MNTFDMFAESLTLLFCFAGNVGSIGEGFRWIKLENSYAEIVGM